MGLITLVAIITVTVPKVVIIYIAAVITSVAIVLGLARSGYTFIKAEKSLKIIRVVNGTYEERLIERLSYIWWS